MQKRSKICCVTGHREIPSDQREWLRQKLLEELELAIQDGCKIFISGFAQGVDLLFAESVINLKQQHPKLFLEAAIPYPNRITRGNAAFKRLLRQCNAVKIVSDRYSPDCFHKRNRYMVEQSDRVIAVYDGRDGGGTVFTIRYAQVLDKEIRVIQYESDVQHEYR